MYMFSLYSCHLGIIYALISMLGLTFAPKIYVDLSSSGVALIRHPELNETKKVYAF